MEKIYLGQGKAQKYGVNYNLDLNSLLEHLYKETTDKNVIEAMKLLKKVDYNNVAGFFEFTTKEGKKIINANITTNQMKNPNDKGKTHYLTLNTWKPEQKEENIKNDDDDLVF